MNAIGVITMAGDAHSRGKAFGAAQASHLRAFLFDWLEALRATGIEDPYRYVIGMLGATHFIQAIKAHASEQLEEVRGIADGARLSAELLLASQLLDEEWAYRPTSFRSGESLQKCSSAAFRSSAGITWIGQNMDLGGYTNGHQIALRIARSSQGPGMLIFTVGSMIALMGVNTSGVGICVNSLPQLPSAHVGLPVAFMIRKLLEARSAAEAERSLHTLPHATGQHYLIADASEICSLEASPAGVRKCRMLDPLCSIHTNHPLAGGAVAAKSAQYLANTIARLKSLQTRLQDGERDLDAIKAALSSHDNVEHPVCRPLARGGSAMFTTGSMISQIGTGPTVQSWMSPGPPCLHGYQQVCVPDL